MSDKVSYTLKNSILRTLNNVHIVHEWKQHNKNRFFLINESRVVLLHENL